MKIPKAVKGRQKIRDSKICSLYATDNWSMEDIAKRFGISATRVHTIIWRNRELIKVNREWEEVKQLHRIRNHIKKKSESSKDVYDWESLLNSKIDKRPDGSQSGDTKIIIVRPDSAATAFSVGQSGISIVRPQVANAISETSNAGSPQEVSG
jgi:predicted DNA-binding protein YlxM (UPF0122 family)